MKLALIDMDNCISDDGWRIPKIDWTQTDKQKRYHEYHMLAKYDQPNIGWIDWTRHDGYVILTARPVLYRELTVEWLQRHMPFQPAAILMRNNNDGRASPDIKRDQLGWLLCEVYEFGRADIGHAYDDHPGVVAMYTENGIPATVQAIHNVDAYLNPLTGARHE